MNAAAIWRAGATADELAQVAAIDAMTADLDATRAGLTKRRYLIINRACQRERTRRGLNRKEKG